MHYRRMIAGADSKEKPRASLSMGGALCAGGAQVVRG